MSDDSILPFNIILPIFIVFSLIGLYWLSQLGLSAGPAYMWLIFIGVILLGVVIIAKKSGIDFWFEIPINRTSERGVLMLFLGVFVLLMVSLVSLLTQSKFYSPFVMSPLVQFSQGVGAETFSALQAATSPFWTAFISIISASVWEEIILGFVFVLIGSLVLGYGLRKLLHLDFGDVGNEIWDFVGAITFSIILFTVLHGFNRTYLNVDGTWNMSMFMYAAGFRAVLNILIYKFGNFGLLFGIGVHSANNAIALGSETVFKAILTFPGGIILIAVFGLLIFFAVVSAKKIIQEGEWAAKDFMTWD